MAKNEQDDKGKQANNYIKFSGTGFQMIAIIGIFTYAGYKIDQAAHHNVQWATAALALCGVFISLYVVIKSLKD